MTLWSPQIGADGHVVAYGHYGRPVLAFPSQAGRRVDWEDRGMVAAIAPLIDAGRVKLYCVDSFDRGSWLRDDLPLDDRARLHEAYEGWILDQVLGFIASDCHGRADLVATGCSFGAYHAANLALRHPHRVPVALCMSGVYDLGVLGWGDRGGTFLAHTPLHTVGSAGDDHLDWLRTRLQLTLVCGQGAYEDSTGALHSTRTFGGLLRERGMRAELDLWGHDIPHDWSSWRLQLAHHLPRHC